MKNELLTIGLGLARGTAEFVLFIAFVLLAFKTLLFPARTGRRQPSTVRT